MCRERLSRSSAHGEFQELYITQILRVHAANLEGLAYLDLIYSLSWNVEPRKTRVGSYLY